MPELLKNIYSPSFFEQFTETVKQVLPKFNKQQFLNQIFDTEWEAKELKQRMRSIATSLKNHLPGGYAENVASINCVIQQLQKNGTHGGFAYMFFPDFIEQYGLKDLNTSLQAMESITQFISCEFAVRPFLVNYPEEVMGQMLKWSKHPNHSVRRFSSEGCRPRLPWAMAIPYLKRASSVSLLILENLRNDASLFVRKSVANHLNDISRDNPHIVIDFAKKWKGESKETDWIIKHGCRTLLKNADENVYEIFELTSTTNCVVNNLKLSNNRLKIGERLGFSFKLTPTVQDLLKLRIEYAIYYNKANGKQTRKLFKLSENQYQGGNTYLFNRSQRFQDFTTRKHYPGKHKIGIVVNGKELAVKEFVLLQ